MHRSALPEYGGILNDSLPEDSNLNFSKLGLSAPVVKAVVDEGYETPTPVQAKAIPAIIQGRDVMAAAQTGTGKTAGFTLPILERLIKGRAVGAKQVRVLVLTPTRELAAQINESIITYGRYLNLKSTVVFGGVKINAQIKKLQNGVDILVATPGRLLDLYSQNFVQFQKLEILVLDEADRMLDMGFIHDIKKILALLPRKRQNLLFSATLSDDIRRLAKGLVHNPVEISVSPEITTAQTVKQWIYPVDKNQKSALLAKLIEDFNWQQVLVFSRTKHGANKLTRFLQKNNIQAAAIHGNRSQNQRTKALADFKQFKTRILVATDIAARGLDIDQLPQVVNFDLPHVPEDYVHRIGRTGRAGANGNAVSLVSAEEFKQLSDIERLIKKILKREIIEEFKPVHKLPESNLTGKSFQIKKSNRPGNSGHNHRNGHRRDGKPAGRNQNSRNPRKKNSL